MSTKNITIHFLLILITSLSMYGTAHAEPELFGRIHGGLPAEAKGNIEGERIDLKKGGVTWETLDVSIPGNGGLDLDVYRSFMGGERIERPMEDWSISLPRITMATNPGGKVGGDHEINWAGHEEGICGMSPELYNGNILYLNSAFMIVYKAWADNLDNIDSQLGLLISLFAIQLFEAVIPNSVKVEDFHSGLFLTIPGEGTKSLLFNMNEVNIPLRYDEGMASSARYVTTDNWLVECAEDNGSVNNNFIAHSPDGKTYHFNKRNKAMGDPLFLKLVGQNIWYPSEVLDKFGNKLSYDYYEDSYYCVGFDDFVIAEMASAWDISTRTAEGISGPVCPVSYKIKSIISSPDDRQVDFIYENPRSLAEDVDQYKHGSRRIKEIVVGDSVWKYRYEKFESGKSNYLSEVELPDGSTWSYTKKPTAEAGFAAPFGGNDWARSFLHPRRYDGKIALPDDWVGLINRGIGLMDTVTTPMGATIQYGYERKEIKFFDHVDSETKTKIPVLTSRDVSGHDLDTRLWSYKHTKDDAKGEFYTEVSEPNVANGDLVKTMYTFDHSEGSDHYGVLIKEQKYGGNILLLTKEMKWKTLGTIGIDDHVKERPKSVRVMRALEELRITNEDGLVFTTEYLDFDKYGKAKTSKIRSSVYSRSYIGDKAPTNDEIEERKEYQHNTDSWILNVEKKSTLKDSFTGDVIKSQTINTLGLPERVVDEGVIMNTRYYPTGDKQREYWVNDGVNYENIYKNYNLGTAEFEQTPGNSIIRRSVSGLGSIEWEINENGIKTEFEYDGLGRMTLGRPPVMSNTVNKFNIDGNPRKNSVSRGANERIKTFDPFGNELSTEVIGTDSGVTVYTNSEYDARGNKTFEGLPAFQEVNSLGISNEYDALDRLVKRTDARGNIVTYCHRVSCLPAGYPFDNISLTDRIVKVETIKLPSGGDAGGSVSEDIVNIYVYKFTGDFLEPELSEVYQQKTDLGGNSRYVGTIVEKSPSGAVEAIYQGGESDFQPNNNSDLFVRTFTYYPGTTRIHRTMNPEVGETTFVYDDQGNVKSRSIANGPSVTFKYDGKNQLVYEDYDNTKGTADVSYGYDYKGNMKWADNGYTRWEYQYNSEDLLELETLKIGNQVLSLDLEYDYDGKIRSLTYPNGEIVETNNDSFNLPTQLGSYVTSLDYYENGLPSTMTYGNGVVASLDKNNSNLVSGLSYSGFSGSKDISETYSYDHRENPYQLTSNIGTSGVGSHIYTDLFKYNELGFIESGNSRLGALSYSYDTFGNLTSKKLGAKTLTYGYYTFGAPSHAYRLKSVAGGEVSRAFEYDYLGNIIDNGIHEFVYDNASNLRQVVSTNESMFYDVFGKRVAVEDENGFDISIYGKNGKLLYKLNTEKNESTNYIYLDDILVAKNVTPCTENCDFSGMGEPNESQIVAEEEVADLVVSIQSSEVVSGTLHYVLAIKNNGPDTAKDTRLSHTFPLNVNVTSVAPTVGYCSYDDENANCSLGNIGVSQTVTVGIAVSGLKLSDLESSGFVMVYSNTYDPKWENNTLIAEKDSICSLSVIAQNTAIFGYLDILRDFRDMFLNQFSFGREITHSYYELSPKVLEFIGESETVMAVSRVFLTLSIVVAWLTLNPIYLVVGLLSFWVMILRRSRSKQNTECLV